MESLRQLLKKIIPSSVFTFFQPYYHYTLALCAALYYRFPSRHIQVIAVTGTKGKSSVVEIITALLDSAGYQTACLSTIHFKIGDDDRPNLHKMTMPGRFFVQRFLREAADAGCQYAVIEITSEGAKQFRHKYIDLNALVFTNLAPEHIESHGSFEAYKACKLRIRDQLATSHKDQKYIVVNRDDAHHAEFLELEGVEKFTYSLADAQPINVNERGSLMTIEGTSVHSPLVGKFNIYNMLAAILVAEKEGVPFPQIKKTLETFSLIRGRAEKIEAGQNFLVVVDYAHTPESLTALYEAFPGRKICILGNTGGGRDTWKRPKMGEIADQYCDQIILTDEDPYDENPLDIVNAMQKGITDTPVEIEMDRRAAIRRGIELAKPGDAVLISGKGTDPYIMRANGAKEEWSDARVAKEELESYLSKQNNTNTNRNI